MEPSSLDADWSSFDWSVCLSVTVEGLFQPPFLRCSVTAFHSGLRWSGCPVFKNHFNVRKLGKMTITFVDFVTTLSDFFACKI